jgi:acyl carrier protein
MERNALRTEIAEIFHVTFDNNNIVLKDDTSANDIEGWDSLKHVALIVAVEVKFNITFNSREVISIKRHKDLEDLILGKLN